MSTTIKALEDYPDISFIDNYTLARLESDMLGWFLKKRKEVTGKTITLGKADERRLMLMAAAYYMFQGYEMVDTAGKMNMYKYASGDFLENLAAAKQLWRLEAAGATTTIRFAVSDARLSATAIPAGSRVTAGDGVYFATDEYAEIPAGGLYADVRATCLVSGEASNNYAAGEITHMVDVVPFVDSVTNVTVPEGGRERESDDQLKERLYRAPDKYTDAGSKGGYEYFVKEFDTAIEDVRASSDEPRVGVIKVLMKDGEIPGEEFLSALSEYLEEKQIRKMTDSVTVEAPDVVKYDLVFTYYINESDRSRAETIQAKVEEAYQDYILWQKSRIGLDINPDELVNRVKSAGAKRVVITSPEFTRIDNESVAVCDDISVTYGGLEDD